MTQEKEMLARYHKEESATRMVISICRTAIEFDLFVYTPFCEGKYSDRKSELGTLLEEDGWNTGVGGLVYKKISMDDANDLIPCVTFAMAYEHIVKCLIGTTKRERLSNSPFTFQEFLNIIKKKQQVTQKKFRIYHIDTPQKVIDFLEALEFEYIGLK